MAFGNTVSIVGNMTRDPELRYTPNGASVCNFGVAWNKRYQRNGEQVEEVSYFDVSCWGTLAENVAASLTKGTRVVVSGELEQRSWETPQGDRRSKVEIKADDVSPSLRWASVEVTRNPRDDNFGGGGGGFGGGGGASQPAQNAPAPAPAPNYNYDEEPF
jgi:single-strand DNA-binding protein